jgi:dipeptidase D
VDFNGGTLRNAIPREAFATVAVPAAKADELKKLSGIYLDILKNELSAEKNLTVVLESFSTDKAALTAQSRDSFVQLLNATPNGVIRNSDVAKGVVNLTERGRGHHERRQRRDHLPDPFAYRQR